MRVANSEKRNLLLLSNSRDDAGRFLHHAREEVQEFFANVKQVTFVPYAGVTISWDAYTAHVRDTFSSFGVQVQSVHECANAVDAVRTSEAIAVGGGNTFQLLAELQRNKLVDALRDRALEGVPYMGWSAGSVIACPTMQTTNDMPIAEPASFRALGLVGFQINAHFTDVHPVGFQGETRRQRLAEYVTANADSRVIGLPEGTWLRVAGSSVTLHGAYDAHLFRANSPDEILHRGEELSDALEGDAE